MVQLKDDYYKLVQNLLFLLNEDRKSDIIAEMTNQIKEYTGFDAVAIRFKDGEDFPYYCQLGFSESHVRSENYLAARSPNGYIRDYKGKPQLECMCGHILQGEIETDLPFYDQFGSFVTNSTTYVVDKYDSVLPPRMRYSCLEEGYETMAIIPIRIAGENIGLLQLNDMRKGLLNPEKMKDLEAIAGILGDIYRRKEIEFRLQDKQREQEMLLDNIDALVFYLKDPETFGAVNQAFADFFDITKTAIQGKNLATVFPREILEGVKRRIKKVFTEKRRVIGRKWIANSEGEERLLECTFLPKLTKTADVEHVIVTSYDITEEVKTKLRIKRGYYRVKELAEELQEVNHRLVESQRLFKANFEESLLGMVILDTEGRVINANTTSADILGYEAEELQDMDFENLLTTKNSCDFEDDFNRLLTGEIPSLNYEIDYKKMNGELVWIIVNISLAKNEENEPLYIIMHLEDITEKKEAQETILKQRQELENSRLRTRFFANLSHELRTPLNLIFTALQMLNMFRKKSTQSVDISKLHRYIDVIEQNSFRLSRMVNNLVDINKMEARTYDLYLQNIDIANAVGRLVGSVKEYIEEKGRVISFYPEFNEKIIACDLFSLERIMLNLFSNAIKFTKKGDRIMVQLAESKSYVEISVKDTGRGMKKEEQEIIFREFGQVDKSFTRTHEGSGLGLSIVKSLVELHNGEIDVNSQYGQGSEFIIKLPRRILSAKEQERSSFNQYYEDNIDRIRMEFADIYDG